MQRQMSNVLITRDLLSEKSQNNGGSEKRYESKESVSIKVRTVRSTNGVILSEGIEANSSKSYSYSRVATRRFTSAHIVNVGDVQPFDFSGMDSSAVISAWSLSRPRVDLFATDSDIHREFGADFLNLIPTDGDLAKWISDCDAFIKDGHLGADKSQVEEVAEEQRPTQGCDKASQGFHEETLCAQASREKIDGTGEEVTTSRAVDLRISHTSSLSRKVMR